jgi:hypothetical protein
VFYIEAPVVEYYQDQERFVELEEADQVHVSVLSITEQGEKEKEIVLLARLGAAGLGSKAKEQCHVATHSSHDDLVAEQSQELGVAGLGGKAQMLTSVAAQGHQVDLMEPMSPNGNSVNTQDWVGYMIEDAEESEGENTSVTNAELGNIPEASLAKSGSRWSKCRAGDTDEDSLKSATKQKAQRNEGDIIPNILCFNLDDSAIQLNLDVLGISLGSDKDSVSKSITKLKVAVHNSSNNEFCCDKK